MDIGKWVLQSSREYSRSTWDTSGGKDFITCGRLDRIRVGHDRDKGEEGMGEIGSAVQHDCSCEGGAILGADGGVTRH